MPDQEKVFAYIGLGSNLDNPLQQVTSATHEIGLLENCEIIATSRWYRSEALLSEQPDFINGAIKIATTASPEQLLAQLQAIEDAHGRQRKQRWGPRTLDLDILLYDKLVLNTSKLHIPHPEIPNRNFVLMPLADLEPALQLPSGTSLDSLLENCPTRGIVAIEEGDLIGKFK